MTVPRRIGQVTHGLTHRRYEFDVFVCEVTAGASCRPGSDPAATSADGRPRAWTDLKGLSQYPIPRPHLKIAAMLDGL
jgi:hypothetical protein